MPEPHDAQATHDARPAGRPQARTDPLSQPLDRRGRAWSWRCAPSPPADSRSRSLRRSLHALTSIDELPRAPTSCRLSPASELSSRLAEHAHGSSYDFRHAAACDQHHPALLQPADRRCPARSSPCSTASMQAGTPGRSCSEARRHRGALGLPGPGAPGDVQRLVGFLSDAAGTSASPPPARCDTSGKIPRRSPPPAAPDQPSTSTRSRYAIVEALDVLAQCRP